LQSGTNRAIVLRQERFSSIAHAEKSEWAWAILLWLGYMKASEDQEQARKGVNPENPGAGVGAILRGARLARDEDLREVAAALRIRLPYLQALESGAIEDLPGVTYGIGFVRAYASYLDLDSAEIVDRFKVEARGISHRTQLQFPEPLPGNRVPGAALLLIVLLLAGGVYGVWLYSSSQNMTIVEAVEAVPARLMALVEQESTPDTSAPVETAVDTPGAPENSDTPLADGAETESEPSVTPSETDASNAVSEPETSTGETDTANTADAIAPATSDIAATPTLPSTETTPAETAPSEVPSSEAPPSTEPTSTETPSAEAPQATASSDGAETEAATQDATATSTQAETQSGAAESASTEQQRVDALPEPEVPAPPPQPSPPQPSPPEPNAAQESPTADTGATSNAPQSEGSAITTQDLAPPPQPAPPENSTDAVQPETVQGPVTDPAPTTPPLPAVTQNTNDSQTAASPSDSRIIIQATQESWIQVKNAQGQVLIEKLMLMGEIYRVPDRPGLTLSSGNIGALKLIVNGTMAPTLGTLGEVRRDISLTPENLLP
jgi:cytoskeleton protein RodZ